MVHKNSQRQTFFDSKWQFRLHWLYFALAGFNLLAFGLGVFLIDQITDIHAAAVRGHEVWGHRLDRLASLTRLAAKVNAPGNDVFDSRDAAAESQRLTDSYAAFSSRSADLKIEFAKDVSPQFERSMLQAFEPVDATMALMVDEARQTLDAHERAQFEQAAQHMAEMDQRHLEVIEYLAKLGDLVRSQESADIEHQTASALTWQNVDLVAGAVMCLMVLGVASFGVVTARRMKHAARLAEAHLQMSARMATVGSVAAGLGHDLGNLLFSMRANVDALEAQTTNAQGQAAIQSLRSVMSYLQSLVHVLRQFTRNESDEGPVTHAEGGAWLRDVLGLIRSSVPRSITISSHAESPIAMPVVPTHRLTQALLNLVQNARDAIIESRGVNAVGRIHVCVEREPLGGMRLSVRDDGAGMSDEVQRKCTQPFFTTKLDSRGTGLGLAMVQSVVNSAGGKLQIQSVPGKGTQIDMVFVPNDKGVNLTPTSQLGGPMTRDKLAIQSR